MPIAKEVGSSLPGDHQNILIFITGLICSAGMGMPVSGFPNQTALVLLSFIRLSGAIFAERLNVLIASFFFFGPVTYRATQEDELGELYLTNVDFLKNGVPASIIATLVSFFFPRHQIRLIKCSYNRLLRRLDSY